MPAAVTHVRSTYTDNDSINAAAFNVLTAVSATVADATAGSAGVMPSTTTAAGLSMIAAADATAQRALLSLSTMALQAAGAVAITGGTIAATPISGSTGAFTTVTASSTIAATGAVTGSNLSGTNTGDQTTITGNAGSATILQTGRNINGVSFNGSADITVTAAAGTLTGATLASGVTASSLTSVGTIASLVATTADINGGTIDGTTVGATTPSTVAATTGLFSGSVKFSGSITTTGANSIVLAHNGTDAQVWALGPNVSTQGQLVIVPARSDATSAAVAATFNASGGNGAWGATTASTGAFTTLSATGAISTSGNTTNNWGAGGTSSSQTSLNLNGGSGAGGGPLITGANNSVTKWFVCSSGAIFGDTSTHLLLRSASDNVYVQSAGATIGIFSPTGLAVTGTSGATSTVWSGSSSVNVTVGSTDGALLGSDGYVVASNNGNPPLQLRRRTSDGTIALFYRDTTNVGNISVTTTATAYNTSSDYRLKNISGPVAASGAFIDALKPKVGTWKSNGDKFVGFLAHEFAEVSPSSVVGEKDAVDADGNPKYQGMQASSAEVIANLVAELQSLRARVAALESN